MERTVLHVLAAHKLKQRMIYSYYKRYTGSGWLEVHM